MRVVAQQPEHYLVATTDSRDPLVAEGFLVAVRPGRPVRIDGPRLLGSFMNHMPGWGPVTADEDAQLGILALVDAWLDS